MNSRLTIITSFSRKALYLLVVEKISRSFASFTYVKCSVFEHKRQKLYFRAVCIIYTLDR